ncbi:hypothetical protein BDR04DRAFT_1121605 [Suillus decipiens]|nr:hypothetical protein BDR04DRAFT_1121605 [Suillus decipiens]
MTNTFFMPLPTSAAAPYFDGNAKELLTFFGIVDELSAKAGIADKANIKFAVQCADPDKAELWRDIPEYDGNDFEDFTNVVLQFYPGYGFGSFKWANTETAATPAVIPCELEPISYPDTPLQLAVQDISPAISTGIISAPTASPINEIAPSADENDLKLHPAFNGTLCLDLPQDMDHCWKSSGQSLSPEIPCNADNTVFYTICSTCLLADCLCAIPEPRQPADALGDSGTCLDHPGTGPDAAVALMATICTDIPLLPTFLPNFGIEPSKCDIPADLFASIDGHSTLEDAADTPEAPIEPGHSILALLKYRILAPNDDLAVLADTASLPLSRPLTSAAVAIVESPEAILAPPPRLFDHILEANHDFTLQSCIFSPTPVTGPTFGFQYLDFSLRNLRRRYLRHDARLITLIPPYHQPSHASIALYRNHGNYRGATAHRKTFLLRTASIGLDWTRTGSPMDAYYWSIQEDPPWPRIPLAIFRLRQWPLTTAITLFPRSGHLGSFAYAKIIISRKVPMLSAVTFGIVFTAMAARFPRFGNLGNLHYAKNVSAPLHHCSSAFRQSITTATLPKNSHAITGDPWHIFWQLIMTATLPLFSHPNKQ